MTWMTAAIIGLDLPQALPLLGVRQEGSRVTSRDLSVDPGLPVASMDIIVLAAGYRDLERPEQLLAYVRSAIKPLGRLYVVGSRREPILEEIEAAGFDPVEGRDALLIFQRP